MPARTSRRSTAVEASTGNVFRDLGLPASDELLAKAELARGVRQLIEARQMTQGSAAQLLGTSQPRISDLYQGRLQGFTMERLYRFLNELGQDIRIVVRPKSRASRRGSIRADVRRSAA